MHISMMVIVSSLCACGTTNSRRATSLGGPVLEGLSFSIMDIRLSHGPRKKWIDVDGKHLRRLIADALETCDCDPLFCISARVEVDVLSIIRDRRDIFAHDFFTDCGLCGVNPFLLVAGVGLVLGGPLHVQRIRADMMFRLKSDQTEKDYRVLYDENRATGLYYGWNQDLDSAITEVVASFLRDACKDYDRSLRLK